MESKPTVTITKEEYFRLRCAEVELGMLEAGGVDNWDWYGESLELYEDRKNEIHEEIFGEQS